MVNHETGNSLEVEAQRQLDDARVAAVHQVGPVEDTSAALNVVDVSRRPLRDADRLRAVNRTRRELRVVEGVEEIGAQLDGLAFRDIEVLEDLPEELKDLAEMIGESSLRGHLKAEGDEQTGSQSYIPPDPNNDKALHTALDLIRGVQKNSAYPPNSATPRPN